MVELAKPYGCNVRPARDRRVRGVRLPPGAKPRARGVANCHDDVVTPPATTESMTTPDWQRLHQWPARLRRVFHLSCDSAGKFAAV